eukprot:4597533-Pleurochrysis_carterae.AAC.4
MDLHRAIMSIKQRHGHDAQGYGIPSRLRVMPFNTDLHQYYVHPKMYHPGWLCSPSSAVV